MKIHTSGELVAQNRCPACGAPRKIVNSEKCERCNTIVAPIVYAGSNQPTPGYMYNGRDMRTYQVTCAGQVTCDWQGVMYAEYLKNRYKS